MEFFFFFFLLLFRVSFFCGSLSMLFKTADILSQSLNLLVLPLPSRHDDNCSIGTIGGGRMPDAIAPHACSFNSSADYELALILKEIRFITDQVSTHISCPKSPVTPNNRRRKASLEALPNRSWSACIHVEFSSFPLPRQPRYESRTMIQE